MIPTRSVPDVLQRARDLSAPGIERALGRLSPEVRPLIEYHLGLADEAGRPIAGASSGKGVRPALAILSAEAAGAEPVVGVPGAVAVELVHNFSLLHDDVIDCDRERRHRPTVWALFGIGRAIIAGDALLALAQQVLLEAPGASVDGRPAPGPAAALCLADATAAMIAGQALDMAFETLPGVDVARCLSMEAGKTGALLGCASSLGAILAGAPDPVSDALRDFGTQLGLAFQAVDDLLGIWGDPGQTGKPAWSDIRQHKKTLPIAAALSGGDARADELAALLSLGGEMGEEQVARAAWLVEHCGGRAMATDEARDRLAAALAALEAVPLETGARDALGDVARFVVAREF